MRSEGLFGSETGSPRTRAAFLRHGYLVAGVVGGPNPACGPHAKKSLRPKPRKNRPPPGLFRYKRRSLQKDCLLFKKSEKFLFAQKRPPRVVGVQRFCEFTSWEGKERPTNLARPSGTRRKGFYWGIRDLQKTPSPTKQKPPRRRTKKRNVEGEETAPAENEKAKGRSFEKIRKVCAR